MYNPYTFASNTGVVVPSYAAYDGRIWLPTREYSGNFLMLGLPKSLPVIDNRIKIEMANRELWEQFHRNGTETIITKSGRRMFPTISASVTVLEPRSKYILAVDMQPIDDHRYKYHNRACGPPHYAWKAVHPPRLSSHSRPLDEETFVFSQGQAH